MPKLNARKIKLRSLRPYLKTTRLARRLTKRRIRRIKKKL